MGEQGWEWPFLLLVLARFPDDLEGERAAAQEWSDIYIAWRSDQLADLAALRRRMNGDP